MGILIGIGITVVVMIILSAMSAKEQVDSGYNYFHNVVNELDYVKFGATKSDLVALYPHEKWKEINGVFSFVREDELFTVTHSYRLNADGKAFKNALCFEGHERNLAARFAELYQIYKRQYSEISDPVANMFNMGGTMQSRVFKAGSILIKISCLSGGQTGFMRIDINKVDEALEPSA